MKGMLVGALLLAGCEVPGSKPCKEDALEIARIESVKSQTQAQKAANDRILEIQLAVAKACTSKGNVPEFQGGNVTCRKQ